MRRAALACCVGALTGCSSVLGLDAPTLDPCLQGGCADAAFDATAEATTEASDATSAVDAAEAGDAHPEASPESGAACVWDGALPAPAGGVRCGGGCEPAVSCAGATPLCCQTADPSGALVFACTSVDAGCAGYTIGCVNENDCSGNDVCCHYMAHMVCAASCTSSADITCVPGSANDCPTGKKCDVRLVNGDAAAPYYACEP